MNSTRWPLLLAAIITGACAPATDDTPAAGATTAESNGAVADSGAAASSDADSATAAQAASRVQCAEGNGGITLPAGFCASVFADLPGGARHIAVAPNGDVFVSLQSIRGGSSEVGATVGGVFALRDTTGDGVADVRQSFGQAGGTGIAYADGHVYVDAKANLLRYQVPRGALRPSGEPDTIVTGLPLGGHSAHSFALDGRGNLFVNHGSRTNSCQVKDRQTGSMGVDPCVELEQRAGIWRYSATAKNQVASADRRYATGIRNAVAIAVNPADRQLWVAQHGRDQLFQNWGTMFTQQQSAELPAEELMRVSEGDDYGWPYCYFDQQQGKRVTAPEYGGDGRKTDRCGQSKSPVATFPGHWAPNGLGFYTGRQFPAKYRSGVFVAFHGSWNRAPLPQGGYKVVFVPLGANGARSGEPETFADGFAGVADGQLRRPGDAKYRPVGLATAPDGAMYIGDDVGGRIWKVVHGGTRR